MNITEWLNLIFRWIHVVAAILWVGSTFYFTWLDGRMRRLEAGQERSGVWMVHSGGFYTVVKQTSLGVAPDQVHWFRWEAMVTFLSGFALMTVVYYHGGLMVDPIEPAVSPVVASAIGVGTLFFGWPVYDLLARSPLAKHTAVFGAIGLAVIVAIAAGLSAVLSTRATYIHIGGLFGVIMVNNVWMRILPPQRRMIAAGVRGEPFDPAAAAGAKRRSMHNTFLAIPTVLVMISNHYPTATYGNRYAIPILAALILVGWAAAAWLRR
ncbi:MAG TPA: urate hydroxylase PuuD [Vicinamibacterales bacterium]|nr:urate hydroxylase PuuD [Vicinamibacterales bacterium]